MNTKTIALIFIIGIVILGGAVLFASNKSQNQILKNTQVPTISEKVETPNKIVFSEIVITSTGANPQTLTGTKGLRVKFINKTTKELKIRITGKINASLQPGDDAYYSPVFTDSGTYIYTDESNSKIKGEIIIE